MKAHAGLEGSTPLSTIKPLRFEFFAVNITDYLIGLASDRRYFGDERIRLGRKA